MKCPRCGSGLDEYTCERCRFDLRSDQLYYFGIEEDEYIHSLGAHIKDGPEKREHKNGYSLFDQNYVFSEQPPERFSMQPLKKFCKQAFEWCKERDDKEGIDAVIIFLLYDLNTLEAQAVVTISKSENWTISKSHRFLEDSYDHDYEYNFLKHPIISMSKVLGYKVIVLEVLVWFRAIIVFLCLLTHLNWSKKFILIPNIEKITFFVLFSSSILFILLAAFIKPYRKALNSCYTIRVFKRIHRYLMQVENFLLFFVLTFQIVLSFLVLSSSTKAMIIFLFLHLLSVITACFRESSHEKNLTCKIVSLYYNYLTAKAHRVLFSILAPVSIMLMIMMKLLGVL